MRGEDVVSQPAAAVGICVAARLARIATHGAGFIGLGLAIMLCGCATAPITQSGALASYQDLAPSNGVLAKSLLHIDKDAVLAAKTVRISPAAFSPTAAPALSDEQRKLVANAVNRALCMDLSERFKIVGPGEPADLTTRAVVTQASPTDKVAAGASKVVSVVPSVLGVPAPVPRLPIGLGSLTIEAEALDQTGRQQAAMVWARGADSFTNSPTVSSAGDAYELAVAFGGDFGQLLVTGETPFGKPPKLPSFDKMGSSLGGKPKYAACEMFGRDPGLVGLVANRLGAPPEWSDKGAPPEQQATETASRQ
ncbi:DUF3313 domain-containing protein [Bradyrhizobium sp. SZCCHNPS2010]|uniref:DUF3313 domain-containing protein n=1 Tax=Bradyrhizobium sp. SZCCHNPS2010 TaxID=3057333 RepID=UPI0029169203|nr:DUF3313 domain-containing protein [Bradyrhizobium sp. SZCCHNPS2010]